MLRLAQCTTAALLLAMCAGCDPADRWGTPEYFERPIGVPFAPEGQVVRCQHEGGIHHVAFTRVRLPQHAVDALRSQVSALSRFPQQLEHERNRRLRSWAAGPLSTEAQAALELALAGAADAVEKSGCATVVSDDPRQVITGILARPTTFYTYQYSPTGAELSAEALEFRVLDLDAGVLYELVNFS